ncbi:amino acid adenylation domain-containing protein [Streptomyces sp. NBC_00237]|uniref:amino acid adenylation domain-containing protein n=1 Tax=Streptomyces sp. NBC_00237 TaxID=2975687 RepID=UPI002255ED81|nr:amino acid adenylation domain-containing protein [Streptomyces sp. NBC_00237]MCX5206182.1 amino acid adenylation domain-containing protein [Streptomyces sp. NBC_00237]
MTGLPTHYPDLPLADGARERSVAAALTRSEPYPLGEGVHAHVERHAAARPDRTAVEDGEQNLSYRELADRMQRVAAQLAAADVTGGKIVAVGGRRGVDVVCAFLALELLGAVYLPVDASWPAARVDALLRDSGAVLLLTVGGPADSVELVKGAQAADVRTASPAPADAHRTRPSPPPADEVRYVLYTSGSTGRPKAAVVEHQGMLNHLWAKIDDLGLTEDDRLAQTAPLSFDISVWQMLAPLLVGGRVQIFGDDRAQDGTLLLEAVRRSRTTVLESVPTLIRFLLDAQQSAGINPGALRWMIATGEELPPALARRWHEALPGVALLNAYGPTECSDDVTHAVLGPPGPDVRHLPIGGPIGNAALYVLRSENGRWHACDHGETGELFVGGLVVGRGYLGDPERTALSFFADPFTDGGGRLYRTGDAVRVLPDGQLEYLGRVDRQVKLGGVRMELAEIEAELGAHPAVAACAVAVRADGDEGALVARESAHAPAAGRQRLVAYVTTPDEEVTEEALRAHLTERLPAPMVPHTFVVLPRLPLTRNGKTDYQALPPPPRRRRPGTRPFSPPRTEAEAAIAALVAELLGSGRVGRDDSFLELGGDSLHAMRLVARLRDTGSAVSLRDVLRDGSPAALAALGSRIPPADSGAGADHAGVEHVGDAPRTRPLTPQQAGVYFHWRLDPHSPSYSYQGSLELDGPLDVPRLAAAWRLLLAENPLLLARFAEPDEAQGDEQRDAVVHHFPHWDVPLPSLPREVTADAYRRLAAEEAARPFDLLNAPGLRAGLFQLPDGQHRVLVTLHELLLDGWGATVLFQRLAELYERRPAAPDPERSTRYDRYLDHLDRLLAAEETAEAGRYWQRQLAGDLPVLQIAQKQRPATPSYRGAITEAVLDDALTQRLRETALSASATAFVPLLAAYALALGYYGDADEVVVGAPMAGRERPETADVPAFVLAMLPLRLRIDPAATLTEFTAQVRDTVYDAYAASDHPFGWTLRRLPAASRSSAATPVFQTMLNMLPYPARATTADGVGFRFVELDTGYTKYDCALYVQPHGPDRLLLQYAYQQELLDEPVARNVLESTVIALRALTDPRRAARTAIRSLDLLPGGGRS